ncbi:helix-turn-helix transcriptional regulator [Demequina activiva]|uniref:DeoR family transcriptional regulator n=1 Tax=Demequina activiva TaxID=1582364 RepID=A0A919Q0Y3_9MICO|nr:WYL domain-containing protein [Demequina activiva]GIG53896.1 DeoR family transcriptional regulator [Demequina activiva]
MATPTTRLLRLLSLLQSRRDWPGRVLAERLDITPRTVRRDVERLREMGYTIRAVKGPDGGYRLEAGAELPPLLFDDAQAIALAVALRALAASGVDVAEASAQALTTVRQVLPARLRHRVDALGVTVAPAAATVAPDALLAVTAAVHASEVLRFRYGHDDGAPTPPRRAEPHHVALVSGRWYLVAWDLDREDWRVFRLDRLTPMMATGRRFTRRDLPGDDVEAFLAARFRGADSGTAWPCTGAATVALALREVAPFVGDGHAADAGAGLTRVTLGSWSWAGLAALLLRFDAALTDVEPAPLREAFARLGRTASAAAGAV